MNKIAAIVVTYNRKNLLKLCLNSLLKEGRALSTIIIVNNDSSDGTEKMLQAEYLNNPIFDYINLGENLGGAGGFNYGMQRAYAKGYDWMWLMDDDVAPVDGALKKYVKLSNEFLFIQGRRAYESGEIVNWLLDYNYNSGVYTKLSESDLFNNKQYVEVNTACFEGAFISREVVSVIGYPNVEFFIQGDDTLYGVLASNMTKVVYTKEVLMTKTLQKPLAKFFGRNFEIYSPFAVYYYVRNLFVIEKFLKNLFPREEINHNLSVLIGLSKMLFKIIFIFPDKLSSLRSFFKAIYAGQGLKTK